MGTESVKKSISRANLLSRWVKAIVVSMVFIVALPVAWIVALPHHRPQLEQVFLAFSNTSTIQSKDFSKKEDNKPRVCLEVGSHKENQRYRPSSNDTDNCLLYEEPSKHIGLLMTVLVGLPSAGRCVSHNGCKPPHAAYDANLRKYGNDWPPYGYTMVGKVRLENFRAAICDVNRNEIPGAIMELGVWRGGAMMMAAAVQAEATLQRELYLFDVFGVIGSSGAYGKATDFLAVPLDRVESGFKEFDLIDEGNIHFVKGLFEQTTPLWENRTDPIAVLRVDANFYDSYQDVMYAMYDKVAMGGIVIFDDVMTHKEVMRFWIDFKSDHGLPEELVRIDQHSAWFRKKKSIQIDQRKKHPPQDVNKLK